MPGIAGVIENKPNGRSGKLAEAMLNCLKYETFYASGTQTINGLGLGICWTCIQGAYGDCLPIWNEAKDICLFFNGEVFVESGELGWLKAKGHQFECDNATWLVHLYEELGLAFLSQLNGWFSGVLVDLREQKIILFNDRYGLSRIYCHQNEERFFFASEAKAILEVLPNLRRFDLQGLGEAIACGCALQNRTIFSGVSLLPGGTAWVFSPGQPPQKEVYFDRRTWEDQGQLSGAAFREKLRETFSRILGRYFSGPNQIGMSLTGGLDGRMIMAWAGRPPGTLPCYTFGGTYRDCTDVKVARQVARACGQPHRVVPVDGKFLQEFPKLATEAMYISDGAMDITGAVELYVNRIAREIAPVRLTGNYGSEIVRRNVAFRPKSMTSGLFEADFERQIEAAAKTYETEARCHSLSFIAFKQVPWHHHSRLSVETSQLILRAPYLDNDLVALMYRVPAHLAASKVPSLELIADGNQALAHIPTDRGLVWRPRLLSGRAQHLYEELTFKAEYAYDYGMPQWLAKIDHVFARIHLERLFLGRHKFYHFRIWYRDKLNEYIKSILLDPRTLSRPYVRKGHLEQIVKDHTTGRGNYTTELHKILGLELIQRELLERRS